MRNKTKDQAETAGTRWLQRLVSQQPPATSTLPNGLPARLRKVSDKELQHAILEHCRHSHEQNKALSAAG